MNRSPDRKIAPESMVGEINILAVAPASRQLLPPRERHTGRMEGVTARGTEREEDRETRRERKRDV